MNKYTVEYQVATYSGQVEVFSDSTDEDEIIAKAKRLVLKGLPAPFGYQSWEIIDG